MRWAAAGGSRLRARRPVVAAVGSVNAVVLAVAVVTAASGWPGEAGPDAIGPPVVDDRPVAAASRASLDDRAPVRLRVGSIAVDAPVVRLGVEAGGQLEVPSRRGDAGWYLAGSAPGEPGPTVIAGHVSLRSGPGVFFRVGELGVGSAVDVERGDGASFRYVIDRVERHPKAAFPTTAVYGATAGAEIRLVTCGGVVDAATGRFTDNVIAFGRLA